MFAEQQLWLRWSQGEISDDEAQRQAEALAARNGAHRRAGSGFAKPHSAVYGRLSAAQRDKVFGAGRCVPPLDRNAKARVMTLARALMQRTEKGKAYGIVTAKMLAVLQALLWGLSQCHFRQVLPLI